MRPPLPLGSFVENELEAQERYDEVEAVAHQQQPERVVEVVDVAEMDAGRRVEPPVREPVAVSEALRGTGHLLAPDVDSAPNEPEVKAKPPEDGRG